MPYRPFEGQNCSIARALAIVGERWTLLILREVLLGRSRFEDIRRGTGVATNILSDRLQTLVDHEILERRPVDGAADGYAATRKGAELMPVLLALMAWGDRCESAGGPPRVPVHAACGHDAHPHLVCAHCGDRLEPRQVKMRPGPGADAQQHDEPLLPT